MLFEEGLPWIPH